MFGEGRLSSFPIATFIWKAKISFKVKGFSRLIEHIFVCEGADSGPGYMHTRLKKFGIFLYLGA